MRRFQHSLTPVLTISGPGDSLANSDHDVEDGEMIFVRSTRQVFAYENPSVQVPDGVTIVASNFGAGNWILVPVGAGGGGSFSAFYNTASAGAAGSGRLLDTSLVVLGALTDGDKVWVRSVQDSYTWNVASVAVSDGVVVVNPTANIGNPGRFVRDQIASTLWTTYSSWYIDPLNPNAGDENDGSAGLTPLRTVSELRRRLNGRLIQQSTTIHIQGNVANTDPFILDFGAIPTATVTVVGSRTAVLVGAFCNSFTARSTGVSPGIPNAIAGQLSNHITTLDLSAYLPSVDGGFLVRMTSGAAVGCMAYPVYYDAAGAVGNLVGTENYLTTFYNSTTRTATNPGGGDTLSVDRCPKIGCYSIAPTGGTWVFQSIYFNQVGSDRAALTTYKPSSIDCLEPSVTMLFQDCSFDKLNPTTNGMVFENCLAIDTVPTFTRVKVLWEAGLLWGLTLGAVTAGSVTVDGANVSFTNGAVAYNLCVIAQNSAYLAAPDFAIFPSGMVMAAGATTTLAIMTLSRANVGTLWAGVQPPPFGNHGMNIQTGCTVVYTNKPMLNRGLGSGRELMFNLVELVWSSIPTLSGWQEPQNGTEIVPVGGAYNWATQATWFVDPLNVAAADENSGLTNLVPLKTDAERQRRWGAITLRQATTVTYNSTVPDSDPTNFDVKIGVGGSLNILGTMTVVKSGTLLAVTAKNRGAQTPWSATSTVAFDGTEVGLFLQDKQAGANNGNYCGVVKNTGGSLRLTEPGQATAAYTFTTGSLTNGDAYDILRPITAAVGIWSFKLADNADPSTQSVVVDGLTLRAADASNVSAGIVQCSNCAFQTKRCILDAVNVASAVGASFAPVTLGSLVSRRLVATAGGCICRGGGSLDGSFLFVDANGVLTLDQDFIVQNGFFYIDGKCLIGFAALFDAGSTGRMVVEPTGTVITQTLSGGGDLLWGTNNTGYAVHVNACGRIVYTTKPTVNGGLGAGRESLVGATDKQWGSIPFADTGATGTQAAIVPNA